MNLCEKCNDFSPQEKGHKPLLFYPVSGDAQPPDACLNPQVELSHQDAVGLSINYRGL